MELLRGVDREKDQSYFLAQVPAEALGRCIFPLGDITKQDVRRHAEAAGLPNAARRSSAGICFIGRRNFSSFLTQYIEPSPGAFVSVESGAEVGAHRGLELYTNGQKARISGASAPWFVAGKDRTSGTVYVAQGHDHPALYSDTAVVGDFHWVAGAPPPPVQAAGFRGTFKARYLQKPGWCDLRVTQPSDLPPPSRFCLGGLCEPGQGGGVTAKAPSLCASTARCGLSHRTRLSCSTTATCVSALVSCGTMEPPSMSMGAPCPFQQLRPSRALRGRVGAPARGALVGDVLYKK